MSVASVFSIWAPPNESANIFKMPPLMQNDIQSVNINDDDNNLIRILITLDSKHRIACFELSEIQETTTIQSTIAVKQEDIGTCFGVCVIENTCHILCATSSLFVATLDFEFRLESDGSAHHIQASVNNVSTLTSITHKQPHLLMMFPGIYVDHVPLVISYTWVYDTDTMALSWGIKQSLHDDLVTNLDQPNLSTPRQSSYMYRMDHPDTKSIIASWCLLDQYPRPYFTENVMVDTHADNTTVEHRVRLVTLPDTCLSNLVRGAVYLNDGNYLLVVLSRFILLYQLDESEGSWIIVDALLPKFASSMVTNMLVCKTSDQTATVMTTGAMTTDTHSTSGCSCVHITLTTHSDGALYMRDSTQQENGPLLPSPTNAFSLGTNASLYLQDANTVITPTLHKGVFYCVVPQYV